MSVLCCDYYDFSVFGTKRIETFRKIDYCNFKKHLEIPKIYLSAHRSQQKMRFHWVHHGPRRLKTLSRDFSVISFKIHRLFSLLLPSPRQSDVPRYQSELMATGSAVTFCDSYTRGGEVPERTKTRENTRKWVSACGDICRGERDSDGRGGGRYHKAAAAATAALATAGGVEEMSQHPG